MVTHCKNSFCTSTLLMSTAYILPFSCGFYEVRSRDIGKQKIASDTDDTDDTDGTLMTRNCICPRNH